MKKSAAFGLSLLLGLYTFSGQIILLRELLSLFPASEIIIGLYFTFWMLSTGAGALLAEFRGRKKTVPFFNLLLISLPLSLLVMRGVRILSLSTPGQLPSPQIYFLCFLLVLPVAFLGGYLFGILAKESRNTSLIYGGDALGSFTAALLLYLVLFTHLSTFASAAIVLFFSCLILFYISRRAFSLSLVLFSLLLSVADRPLWDRVWKPMKVVQVRESRYGRLTLTEYKGMYSAWENASKVFVFPAPQQEKLVFLTLMNSGRKVLVVGGGGRTLTTITQIGKFECTYVDPNREMVLLARSLFPRFFRGVRIIYRDARSFIRSTREHFSALILDLPPPSSPQMNRFFTKEFFEEARRVADTVAFTLEGGTYYSSTDALLISSIYRALKAVFPSTSVVPGEQLLLIGSVHPLDLSPEKLQEFLLENSIAPRQYTPFVLKTELNPFEFMKVRSALELPVSENSDSLPASYIYGLEKWMHHFFPSLRFSKPDERIVIAVVLLLLLLSLLLRGNTSFPFLVAVLGLVSLSFEITLLIEFQYSIGYLYREISLLLGIMMLAMGAGALAGRRFRWAAMLLPLMSTLLALRVRLSLPLFYLFFFLLGLTQGAVFSRLAHIFSARTEHFASIYFWDLLLASFAGITLTLFLLPHFGFQFTFSLIFTASVAVLPSCFKEG